MATSPYYSWPEPDNTDLVKNGALAIRTAVDAIDTSMSELLGGTTGQILSKTSGTNMDFTWITNDVGDITAVTAGTGISGGGTSGAVTVTNSMATTITTKGDLVPGTGSGTFSRLAVGSNGETLVADSSTSTGLRYTENYAAGKNKIINGDFYINQRNFTSQTTDGAYGFDRWRFYASAGGTYSTQTFTPGTAPVTGYEGKNFARIVTTGQSGAGVYTSMDQPIEDVRTFANQTVTISFWAKAATGTPKISLEIIQNFGSGGSGTVVTNATAVTISTAWVRYSVSVAIPSISGATIGAGSYCDITFWVSAGTTYAARTNSIGIQSNTFDIWGVQVEDGSVATAFQTATGTLQGELAACEYYYRRKAANATATAAVFSSGFATATTNIATTLPLGGAMRTTPSFNASGTIWGRDGVSNIVTSAGAIISAWSNTSMLGVNWTVTGASQYRPYVINSGDNSTSFIELSAEL